jgi:hypothetical protein
MSAAVRVGHKILCPYERTARPLVGGLAAWEEADAPKLSYRMEIYKSEIIIHISVTYCLLL